MRSYNSDVELSKDEMLVIDLVLLAVAWIHVLLTPYTKVEESFNLHATHDVFFYGVSPTALKHYDHFVFPGAVPRSFVGSVLLAWTARPIITILEPMGLIKSKFDVQVIIRLLLASLNVLGLIRVRRSVSKRFGSNTGLLFGVLSCSQFHLPFWMGRTLPNMFAMIPFNEALARIVAPGNSPRASICLLAFAAVVFRAELAVYLAVFALFLLYEQRISITRLLSIGAISSFCSLSITLVVDSYFWQKWPMWPELQGIYFNVVQGKSSDWGVSPFHAYFTQALPKLLVAAYPTAIWAMTLDKRMRSLMIPPLVFVLALSCLGHKEWRFVVYVVPIFNIAASYAAANMWKNGKPLMVARLGLLAAIAGGIVITGVLTAISNANYPGGTALREANSLNHFDVNLHICNLAAQTGASLFLHEHASPYLPHSRAPANTSSLVWRYDKTEGTIDMGQFSHAIVENSAITDGWQVDKVVDAFAGVTKRGLSYAPKLWVVSKPDA